MLLDCAYILGIMGCEQSIKFDAGKGQGPQPAADCKGSGNRIWNGTGKVAKHISWNLCKNCAARKQFLNNLAATVFTS